MQPHECFQGVQPMLVTPSYITYSTKPTADSNNPPLCGLLGSGGTLAHRPGGVLILFPLNKTATSWQKPKWREVFSPRFPTLSLCNNRTQIGKRCESQNPQKSCPDPLACTASRVGGLPGPSANGGTWAQTACPRLALGVFPLLGWGEGALRLCPPLWAGGNPPLAQASGGP